MSAATVETSWIEFFKQGGREFAESKNDGGNVLSCTLSAASCCPGGARRPRRNNPTASFSPLSPSPPSSHLPSPRGNGTTPRKRKGGKTTATAKLYSEETSWQKTSVIMLAITSVPPLLAHILLASHSLVSSSSPSRLAAASFLEVGGERKESRGRRGEGGTKFWQ